jgi:hypothetical protein
VLIGGHAVISNSYLRNQTIPGGRTSPNGTGRDPSFEIYRPPYLDCGKQGRVTKVRPVGNRLEVTTDGPARNIASVVLVRNVTTTHIVDADQKSVELKVLSRRGNKLTLAQAPNGAVLPPGPYMVFANKRAGNCLIPSVSRQVTVARKGKVAARSAQRKRQPRFTG